MGQEPAQEAAPDPEVHAGDAEQMQQAQIAVGLALSVGRSEGLAKDERGGPG